MSEAEMNATRAPAWNRESIAAACVLFLALMMRLAFVATQRPGFYFEDSLDYDRAARSYLESGQFHDSYHRLPGYPVLMALIYRLFGTGPLPFRCVQSVIGTLTCFVVWRLARGMFGVRTGMVALALAAVYPLHVVLAGIEYPTLVGMLLTCIVLWMLSLCVRAGNHSGLYLLTAGGSVGLACLVYPAGFALGVFLLVWMVMGRRPMARRLRDLAVLLVAGAVFVGPWAYRMVRNGDSRPIFLKIGVHLPIAPGVRPPAPEGNGWNLVQAKVRGLLKNPGWTLRRQAHEFLQFWNPYPAGLISADPAFRQALHRKDPRTEVANPLVGNTARWLYTVGFGTLLLMSVLGILTAWHRTAGIGILIGWPIVLALCYAPFFSKMRYRIPADPALIILAARALEASISGTLRRELREFGLGVRHWWGRGEKSQPDPD